MTDLVQLDTNWATEATNSYNILYNGENEVNLALAEATCPEELDEIAKDYGIYEAFSNNDLEDNPTAVKVGDILRTQNSDGSNQHSVLVLGYVYSEDGSTIIGYKVAEGNSQGNGREGLEDGNVAVAVDYLFDDMVQDASKHSYAVIHTAVDIPQQEPVDLVFSEDYLTEDQTSDAAKEIADNFDVDLNVAQNIVGDLETSVQLTDKTTVTGLDKNSGTLTTESTLKDIPSMLKNVYEFDQNGNLTLKQSVTVSQNDDNGASTPLYVSGENFGDEEWFIQVNNMNGFDYPTNDLNTKNLEGVQAGLNAIFGSDFPDNGVMIKMEENNGWFSNEISASSVTLLESGYENTVKTFQDSDGSIKTIIVTDNNNVIIVDGELDPSTMTQGQSLSTELGNVVYDSGKFVEMAA